jgi:hypothetical protein
MLNDGGPGDRAGTWSGETVARWRDLAEGCERANDARRSAAVAVDLRWRGRGERHDRARVLVVDARGERLETRVRGVLRSGVQQIAAVPGAIQRSLREQLAILGPHAGRLG